MSSESKFDIRNFAENRIYIATIQTSIYLIPIAAVYYFYFRIFTYRDTSSHRHDEFVAFLIAIIVLGIVALYGMRVKLKSLRNSNEVIIYNLWKLHRLELRSVSAFEVGEYSLIWGIGPKWRVVTVVSKGSRGVVKIPILASYSLGKPTKLLDEILELAEVHHISCDLSKMIY